ncbi:hypothetical protein BTO32_15030 [Marinobacter lutaoensis]|uniref:Uncharacterized protein n=1 Tax=Marinobacter lutaoensis TaxID=135739 RepID=A0A1V2DPE3_9GAMM|nr:hypothetical protein [Marinobacter lutaoensis]ONF42523.1 hypothetical protein BTO32_15030 [Marinobacter lutaoensis]
MFVTPSDQMPARSGQEHPGLPFAGVANAAYPSLTCQAQGHPLLPVLRVPEFGSHTQNEYTLAKAFSTTKLKGQPDRSTLFEHINVLAKTGHLTADQARYLAEHKEQDAVLWNAVGSLSKDCFTDSERHISSSVDTLVRTTFPLQKIVRFAVEWKRAYPASIKDATIRNLNRAVIGTEHKGNAQPPQKKFDKLRNATAAVLWDVTTFLNNRMKKQVGWIELGFDLHKTTDNHPIALSFGGVSGFVYNIDLAQCQEEIWQTTNLALQLITTIACPGMTSADALEYHECLLDEVCEELAEIEQALEAAGVDVDDDDSVDAFLDRIETWVITTSEELQYYRERARRLNQEKKRWQLPPTTQHNLDSLHQLLQQLPAPANEQETKLIEWCRQAYQTLRDIPTFWTECIDASHQPCASYEFDANLLIMLKDDQETLEVADSIHRSMMEGGEEVRMEFDYATPPAQLVRLADTINVGWRLLDALDEAVNAGKDT